MATRSTIAIELDNGTVKEVYCHSDGYISYNGKILNEFYKDIKKINALINLGNISSLGQEIGLQHDFDSREPRTENWTRCYGRDRGETDQEATEYSSYEEYCEKGQGEQYNYIYRNGEWFVDGSRLEDKITNQDD